MTDGCWDRFALLDGRGTILYSSPSSERIYRYAPGELEGRNVLEFIHPEDLPRVRTLFVKYATRANFTVHLEYRALRRDGVYIWMETIARNLVHDPDIRAVVVNEREITNRKRLDAALLATVECGEALIRATSEGELLGSICATIVKMGGYRMAWVAFPEQDGGKAMLPVARAGAGEEYVDRAKVSWAAGDPRSGGPVGRAMRTRKPVACRDLATDPRFAPWRSDALRRGYASTIALPLLWRTECLGTLSIYSDQVNGFNSEEAKLLQKLAGDIAYGLVALRTRAARERLERELLDISEREQRRIAHDLHDGLCQQLMGMSFLTAATQKRLAQRGDPEAGGLKGIAEALSDLAADARALSHGIQPVDSAPGALMMALKDFARVTSRMFGIDCRFVCPRPVRIGQQSTATNLYRIAQEALGNAIKHGASTRVIITLQHIRPGELSLDIRDNGTGIPPQARAGKGMGLQIMRYRAGICGGALEVRKAGPRGTLVRWRGKLLKDEG